jgi:hypothetical protein
MEPSDPPPRPPPIPTMPMQSRYDLEGMNITIHFTRFIVINIIFINISTSVKLAESPGPPSDTQLPFVWRETY